MAIRILTQRLVDEAAEIKRRSVFRGRTEPGVAGGAPAEGERVFSAAAGRRVELPPPPGPASVSAPRTVGLVPRPGPSQIPGGIAERFRVNSRRKEPVRAGPQEAPVTPSSETAESGEGGEGGDAPITIELKSH